MQINAKIDHKSEVQVFIKGFIPSPLKTFFIKKISFNEKYIKMPFSNNYRRSQCYQRRRQRRQIIYQIRRSAMINNHDTLRRILNLPRQNTIAVNPFANQLFNGSTF